MAASIDRQILQIASQQDHVVTRQQLLTAGVSNGSINRRVSVLLVPLARGLFSVGPPTNAGLLRAAVLANPAGALADRTAAELLDLPVRRSAVRSVVVRYGNGTQICHPEVVLRRSRHLPTDDVVDGDLRHTTVERTVCDLASMQDPQQTKRLIEWCITQRRMTSGSFQACLRHYCRSGRSGSKLLRLFDAEMFDNTPIPASELERRGLEALEQYGPGGWEMHYTPPWSEGIVGIVDLGWPDEQLIVELDGRRWHSTSEAIANDRRRDRVAASHGWTVLRFSWSEVVDRPRSFTSEIRNVLTDRAPS